MVLCLPARIRIAAATACVQASSYSQVHAATALLKAGPPPGVQSFCIYGASSDTPLSLKYERPLLAGQPNDMPSVDAVGKGDGVVNLESLRLCKR
jgi:hypothetical protein